MGPELFDHAAGDCAPEWALCLRSVDQIRSQVGGVAASNIQCHAVEQGFKSLVILQPTRKAAVQRAAKLLS